VSERSRLCAVAGAPQSRGSHAPRSRAIGRTSRRQRRRRRVAGLVRFAVFLLLIFIAVWAGVRVAHAGEDARVYTGDHYVVQAGDDLWSIAADRYGESVDLRKAVYVVREANQLTGSSVQPGDDLSLPYLGD
jgi:Tfp pilus assembly protein FimV